MSLALIAAITSSIDLSEALDSVLHKRLLQKINAYEIHKSTFRWIQIFLTLCRQRVFINGSVSSWVPVVSGVPQGSVLGPLLFLIYINDIAEDIKSDLRLFADDCILYRQINSSSDSTILQEDIDRLLSWSTSWQLKFNTEKCHTVCISRKRDSTKTSYFLGNKLLAESDSFSYLGVTVSSDLRWNDHVKSICAKASRTLNFIRRNIYKCHPEVKARAYLSLVRPQLEYASSVWDPYTNNLRDKIEKIQHCAARFVKNNYKYSSSVSEMIAELGWPPLSERRRTARLILFYKAIHQTTAISTNHPQRPIRSIRHSGGNSFVTRIDAHKY